VSQPVDPITEADLEAYLDDQLPAARRIAVEAYLCSHSGDAMRIMADLRIQDELRLALAPPPARRAGTAGAARRLERGLSRHRILQRMRRLAAVFALIATGWLAHAQLGLLRVEEVGASAMPPLYVGDAVMAHRTTLLRAGMSSQRETPEYDPLELRAATAIVMPVLPPGWTVADVQVFPSRFGPSIEVALRNPARETISLFAVRPGSAAATPATRVHLGDLAAAYWQVRGVAYVLVARAEARDVETAATAMAASLD